MKMKAIAALAAVSLVGCAGSGDKPASVERMYVIECGENHVKDLSRWTPGINVGTPHVFGDGSVVIKSTPGHTPGHQSLFVRLPKRGPVLLSGDMVHLAYSWNNRIVPSFNSDIAQSGRSIDAMQEFTLKTGAVLWINHDKEQQASIPKAPAYVE